MEFTPANAWQEFKTASRTEQGTLDDNGNEVVLGPRLNEAVRHLANGYLKTLDLGPENKATDERAKLLDLHWGRIEHDGAQLQGLGAAVTNLAATLAENVTKLSERWQGESYTAFTAAMAKMQRTLSEYGTAATTTGDGMVNAMAQVRDLYQSFAEDSVNTHLSFGDVSPPEMWHKIGTPNYLPDDLANGCPSNHGISFPNIVDVNLDCIKNNDEQRNMIMGHFVTQRRWDICMQDGCEESLDRVSVMYSNLTEQCDAAIERIKGKLHNYFTAVNTTVDGVTKLYDAALGNVYTLANAQVFSLLRVIGAGGGGQPSGHDTGYPGGGGPGPGGGGPGPGGSYPSGSDAGPVGVAEPMQSELPPEPPPEPAVEETAPAAAVAQEPPAGESVQIKDGDRTISVTSPDGEGHVRVTVEDGAGKTKSYELDFDAASGLPREPGPEGAATPEGEAPEQVPARTDGKCVIQDSPLTITAERPLFAPDSLAITVDDGSGNPTKYTVDFDDTGTDAGADTAGTDGTATPGATPPRGTDSQSGPDGTPRATPPSATGDEAAPEAVAGPVPDEAVPASDDAAPGPADGAGPVSDGAVAPGGVGGPARDGAEASSDAPVAAEPESAPDAAEPAVAAGGTAPDEQPVADGGTSPAANAEPKAWVGGQAGSVSGVLVPDQAAPDQGSAGSEAGLATVPDDPQPQQADASGVAGAGMPMMGAPGGSGGATESGRAGSGWSVHGDLFDTGEPVYSMHGVLGDEERTAE